MIAGNDGNPAYRAALGRTGVGARGGRRAKPLLPLVIFAVLTHLTDAGTGMGNGGHKGGICNVDYGIEDLPGIFLTFARANDRFLNVDMLAGASLAFRQRWPCGG